MKKLLIICLLVFAGKSTLYAQFPSVGILGAATPLGWSGNEPDIEMATTDGVVYVLNNISLYSGGLKFRQDNSWPLNWGSTDWPSGVGVQDQGGMDVPVLVGVYDITFNLSTKEYSFIYKFPVIGIRGNASVVDWGSTDGDILFSTTDGVTYIKSNCTLIDGGLKFRQDNDWPSNWGGATWPSGTGIFNQDGVDIPVQAGTYNITFDNVTKEYNFEDTETADITRFTLKNIFLYPNPAKDVLNISTTNEQLSGINVLDATGKIISSIPAGTASAQLDISALSTGIYFVQISTEKSTNTVKFIKN